MPEQIYIGNFAKGLQLDRLPFAIDNDAFPTMFNFYSWRGRAKRKRGTIFLGQLEVQVESVATATPPAKFQVGQIGVLDGAGDFSGNLISIFGLDASASITPGSFSLSDGTNTYTEPVPPDHTLIGMPGGSGTINYATGALTITGGAPNGVLTGTFSYFPGLPVMGLRSFVSSVSTSLYPLLLAFDTVYSYQVNQSTSPVFFYNVNYYKSSQNPFYWSGGDFQQFWTTNYSGALWATNGKAGFNKATGTYVSGSGTTAIVITLSAGTPIVGDYLWFNEWGSNTINLKTGIITNVAGPNITVTFTASVTASGTGLVQFLTYSIAGQDGIKWYDGDPTNGTGIPASTGLGWVNFSPPLSATNVSIENLPAAPYYIVGATAILPFKDTLLFFGPIIQTSSGAPITLQDVVLWSWNGTPYYTVDASGMPSLVPINETANVKAYYVDQTGLGGYLSAGISQPIVTVANNEDVLLVGFGGNIGRQTRFVYTGNDLFPFNFFSINSELSSSATFSAITLDRGAVTIGQYGIILTTQQSSQRIDLVIPDSVFQIQALNNGAQRVNSARDFYREWIYFSYPVNNSSWKFPTQTFLWNYRDDTWAIQYENFTTHGTYRQQSKNTWASIGQKFKTWAQWREPWNSGSSSAQFPSIVAGNPQGYVIIKGQGTGESVSGTIAAIANALGNTEITSTNHCVNVGDYLYFQGALGTTAINGSIGKVLTTPTANTFVVDIAFPGGTYEGLGQYVRLSQPLIQTKQFNPYWDQGRQAILRVQKYLMDYTDNAQITVNIYLSQDPDDAWNNPMLNPSPSSLIYSQLLYTCPENQNIGLTASNVNLQMPTADTQFQIWHRLNTSLLGDSVQIGLTLSDAQMRNLTYATSEIVLQGMHLVFDKGPLLA